MPMKLWGAILIVTGCGGYGFSMAAAQRREERELRDLISALEIMQWDLKYRLTPLPELSRLAAKGAGGRVAGVLHRFSRELDGNSMPEADRCMCTALRAESMLSGAVSEALRKLGTVLGRFDLEGQLSGIESVCELCRGKLQALTENQDNRLRSYQTLGLCAGAALAIVLI